MKRNYAKPEIMFEDFSLNTHIAANCEFLTSNPSVNACAYITDRGLAIFVEGVTGCVTKPANGSYTSGNNTICYHVPSEDFNVFNS